MKILRALLLLPAIALGAVTATQTAGTWDLYTGTSKTASYASLSECVDAAKALNVSRNYTCRNIVTVAVSVTADPPPPPPPTATLSVSPTSLPAGGGTITITYACNVGPAVLSALGQTMTMPNASGTVSGPVSQNATVGLACGNGAQATQSVTVATAPPPNDPPPVTDPPPPPAAGDIGAGLPVQGTTAKPMPALAKPAKGVPFTDPVSGARVIRITDVAKDVPGSTVMKPAYSTVPAWNADESLLILYVAGKGHFLLDGKTYALIRQLDIAPADIEHFYWDGTDPDVLYYPWSYEASGVSKRELVKYHVSSGLKETLWAIPSAGKPACYRADFGSDPVYGAWNQTVFGIRRRCSSDTGNVWNRSSETPQVAGDAPQVSPSGTRFIQNGGLYTSGGALIRKMGLNTVEHGDMTRLANGEDVWASVQFDGPKGSGTLLTENLMTGEIKTVIGQSNGFGYPPTGTHVSGHALRAPGWVAVSVTGNPNGKGLLDESLLVVNLNDGRVLFAGHHHSAGGDGPNGYWAEPHVNISPSGTRLLFGSDWGGGATVDAYVVELPAYK